MEWGEAQGSCRVVTSEVRGNAKKSGEAHVRHVKSNTMSHHKLGDDSSLNYYSLSLTLYTAGIYLLPYHMLNADNYARAQPNRSITTQTISHISCVNTPCAASKCYAFVMRRAPLVLDTYSSLLHA